MPTLHTTWRRMSAVFSLGIFIILLATRVIAEDAGALAPQSQSEAPVTTASAQAETPAAGKNAPVSQDAATAEAEEKSKSEDETGEEELLVSLDFKEADIADVLSAISKAYDLNIIAGKEITGTVSINLTNVTLEDALDAVLGLNKYTYTRDRNIITVVARDQQIKTEILRLEFGTASEVQDLFKNVLSDLGDLRVNEKLNEIVITDVKESIDKARALLYEVDVPPPQVIIEAKLVDIDPRELANLGADMDFNYLLSLSDGSHRFDLDYNLPGPSGTLSGDDIVAQLTTPIFTPANTLTIDSLLQKTKANLLSAPRIAVLNNQAAKIVIGEKVGIREQTQTASGTIESVRFVDIGITLNVTPQINRGGYVTMEISTEVSSVSSFVDNLPRITTREASTSVRVKDRQTIVIAGLLKDEYSETASGLPLIGQIPILGQVLGNFANSRQMKELVIFITPRILRSSSKIDPSDLNAVMDEEKELDSYGVKHEEMMTYFRKDGIKDAVDLETDSRFGESKNYFERAQWFEHMARRRYSSKRFRDVKSQYLTEAADAYGRFSQAHSTDPRAIDAMWKASAIYEQDLGDLENAYRSYRYIVTDQPQSRYSDDAIKRLEKLKKKIDNAAELVKKQHDRQIERLKVLEVGTEEVNVEDITHADIPISRT